jgi:hypothetical protein
VFAGGFEEGVVPLERGEALGGAFAIEGLEELALGVVALQLSAGAGRKKEKQCCYQEKFGISDGNWKLKFKISRRGEEKFEISHAGEN